MITFNKKLKNNYSLEFLEESNLIVGSKNGITLYNKNNYDELAKASINFGFSDIKLLKNEDEIVVKFANGIISFLDSRTLSVIKRVQYDSETDGSNFIITPDNKFVIDGDWDGNIRIIDTERKKRNIFETYKNCMISNIYYDYDDNTVIFIISYRGSLNVRDKPYTFSVVYRYMDGELFFLKQTIKVDLPLMILIYDSFCKRYISIERNVNQEEYLNIYDSDLENILHKIPTNTSKSLDKRISLSPKGSYLFVILDHKLFVYKSSSLDLLGTIKDINTISMSNDESEVAICNLKAEATIISLEFFIDELLN